MALDSKTHLRRGRPSWWIPALFAAGLVARGFAAAAVTDLNVSPAGNDAADGSAAHPFATLDRARAAVRVLKTDAHLDAAITVTLAPGVYPRTSTFELTAPDSGSKKNPVIWKGSQPGAVRLHAGRFIAPEAFQEVKDEAILQRMNAAARGKIVKLDLARAGIRHAGPFPVLFTGDGGLMELFFNDTRMPLSRWPNEGNATMETVMDRGDWSKGPDRHGGIFTAREDRVAHWDVASGVWLEGYWRVPWDPEIVRVKAIDPARRVIMLAEPVSGGIGSKYAKAGALGDGKEPWCAINLLEEIDRPGEWSVDFDSRTLYFWPPAKLGGAHIYISDLDAPLIRLKETSFVKVEGLVIEGGLGNGFEIVGGKGNELAGCTFRNLGGEGATVRGGSENGVRSSEFHDLGKGGIYLSGGDRKTLSPAGNFAENNHLHHLGIRQKTYAAAIHVGAFDGLDAVGCRVAHNLIHDLPHAAVLYGGNDNVFEFNEVYRVVLTSGDMGAFYTTNDWTSQGNILRNNFVYDSPRANAFYMDDGDSGDRILGNVVHGFAYGPFIGGGHDNIVRNNIIVASARGIHLDARGVARGYDHNTALLKRLNSMPYQSAPWSDRYPELVHILDANPAFPRGNIIERNVTVRCPQAMHLSGKPAELEVSTVRDNLDLGDADAGFQDAAHADFRLKTDSVIFKKLPGFEPIPFEKIGLYRDDFRSEIPARVLMHSEPGSKIDVFDSETDVQRSNGGVHLSPPAR